MGPAVVVAPVVVASAVVALAVVADAVVALAVVALAVVAFAVVAVAVVAAAVVAAAVVAAAVVGTATVVAAAVVGAAVVVPVEGAAVVVARLRTLGSGPLCHVMSSGPFINGPQANLYPPSAEVAEAWPAAVCAIPSRTKSLACGAMAI